MSSIFGIVRFDGQPVKEGDALAMRDALNHWNADKTAVFNKDNVMLGGLLLYNTPESLYEQIPFETELCCVTADARIDNRAELLHVLKEFEDIHPASPDIVFIARLYEKFGTACVEYLLGDFAFAIWDKRKQELFAARDHLGIKPLFYSRQGNVFVFATEKKGILASGHVDAAINMEFVYAMLAGQEIQAGEQFHTHIALLPAAHTIQVSAETNAIERYWKFEPKPLLELPTIDHYKQAFLVELKRAVSVRLRTAYPIAAELSGGLDSSGIAGLANTLKSGEQDLTTFSFVLKADNKGRKPYADEETQIDEFVAHAGITKAVKISGSHWRYLQEPHDLDLSTHDGVVSYSGIWQEPGREAMEKSGCRTVLSGFGGDEVVTNRGTFYYFESLEEGRFLAFTKAAWAHRKFLLPFKEALWAVLPGPWRAKMNRDRQKYSTPNSYLLDTAWASARLKQYPPDNRIPSRSQKALFQRNMRNLEQSGRILTETCFGLKHRLEPRYPLLDKRLLEFFMSLPAGVLGHPKMNRYLYRMAMQGILPDSIRLRNDKSVSAGIFETLENRERAEAILNWYGEFETKGRSGVLSKINLAKLKSDFDPQLAQNHGIRGFDPRRAYGTELIMRYFEERSEG